MNYVAWNYLKGYKCHVEKRKNPDLISPSTLRVVATVLDVGGNWALKINTP